MPVCAIGRRSLVTTSIIIPHGLLHIAIIEACVLLSSLFIPMHMIHDFLISFDHWLGWGINLFLKKMPPRRRPWKFFIHAVYNWRPIFLFVRLGKFLSVSRRRSVSAPSNKDQSSLTVFFLWSCLLERKEKKMFFGSKQISTSRGIT